MKRKSSYNQNHTHSYVYFLAAKKIYKIVGYLFVKVLPLHQTPHRFTFVKDDDDNFIKEEIEIV